ncbi:MAG: DUF624 domain-containing protein [Clostridiales bacterium]|nr:DUF624 domain-containing protein [Clostridiales bacterium]
MNILNSKWTDIGELIYNLIVINILMLIGCIPIVTTFTSFTTGFQVIRELKRDETEGIIKSFVHKYKENFLQSCLLNVMMILWMPVFYVTFETVFSTDILLLKIVMILLSLETIMGIIGSLILIEKRVHLIKLIRLGLVDFHIRWHKYFIVIIISAVVFSSILLTKIFIPFILSGTIYLVDSFLELFTRKTEGERPNTFLNVFEKTS